MHYAEDESTRADAVAWTEKAEEYERLAEENPGPTITWYVFDQQGRMIGEYDEDGAPIREYVYFQGAPIAMIKGGQLYWYHTDHLGTPKQVTDGDQNVVWDGVYRPFGEVNVRTEGFRQPVRFPGQYEDAATGLYQNWHRDYDSQIGGYGQYDMLGLSAELNPFAYAVSNPLNRQDPKGLDPEDDRDHPRRPRPNLPGTKDVVCSIVDVGSSYIESDIEELFLEHKKKLWWIQQDCESRYDNCKSSRSNCFSSCVRESTKYCDKRREQQWKWFEKQFAHKTKDVHWYRGMFQNAKIVCKFIP